VSEKQELIIENIEKKTVATKDLDYGSSPGDCEEVKIKTL